MNTTVAEPSAKSPDATEVRASRMLGDLIRVCRDGEDFHRSAAERCVSDSMRAHLMERSHQRAGFVAALQTLQRRHGGDSVRESGSVAAAHRTWNEMRDAFSPITDEAILSDLDAAEASAIQGYRNILNDFPAGLYPADAAVIAFHLREIGRSRDSLRALQTANLAG
ncbi:PA2169 family four-helix-bundle protein [Luteolibacter ambystomatis]|uniref:PA2169 family four-helix-bundle protein n=1 Tax=Luteolibacter ambystomatis TaxID=2824561 RepID=A0A975G7F3_9BACT|nr:PA2169 family four-helix-bundle protein [Luteolibacter ambystomatis]QUE50712.1 PA2169 family four-helix-bundle protein [Luteolibacter ambystomatis]